MPSQTDFSPGIRTLLFDMGNVLVHFSHERMCAQIGDLCRRTGSQVRSALIDSGLQWDFERGRLTEAEFHRRLEQLFGCTLDFERLVHAGSDIFELNRPIVPVLKNLKAGGSRLVLLSNTSISHFQFVYRNFGVLDLFDEFVLSYEVGALKPQPEIFRAALEKIACSPAECFYTDDIPEYVAAGRSHGLQAEVFTDVPSLIAQLNRRCLAVA
jgi:glucose-1-phosphatase